MITPLETTILQQAVLTTSEGEHRFSLRKLWYQLNDLYRKAGHVKIDWPDFKEAIADFEKQHGQIPGLLPPETVRLDERGWPMHVATLIFDQDVCGEQLSRRESGRNY
jgi:hypothetical protein